MEAHVFAVWDFMSLAKRLQADLTCQSIPWTPPKDPTAARFINEIILGEESDVDPQGNAKSHLDLYVDGMIEIGANGAPFDRFLEGLNSGLPLASSLDLAEAPAYVKNFVMTTIDLALKGSTIEVASAFLFGREDVIPDMFERLLALWDGGRDAVPTFAYYLDRHIELDGDTHGPMAEKLIERLAESPEDKGKSERGRVRAIQSRLALWDGLLASLTAPGKTHPTNAVSARMPV